MALASPGPGRCPMSDAREVLRQIEARADLRVGWEAVVDDVPKLVSALRAVLDLHRDIDGDGTCAVCGNWDESVAGFDAHERWVYLAPEVPLPCPTVRAITEALGGTDD